MILSRHIAGQAILLLTLLHAAFAIEYDLKNDKVSFGCFSTTRDTHTDDGVS